jgi:hypothetical protein
MRNAYDRRERMIHETSAFLTWALTSGVRLPRIPRRRVDDGGFAEMMRLPAARAAVNYWWSRTLDAVDRLGG